MSAAAAVVWIDRARLLNVEKVRFDRMLSSQELTTLMSLTFDAARQTSRLVVLDAATLELAAQMMIPQVIPFHFHGQFCRRRDGERRGKDEATRNMRCNSSR